jgi:hypothetical protein
MLICRTPHEESSTCLCVTFRLVCERFVLCVWHFDLCVRGSAYLRVVRMSFVSVSYYMFTSIGLNWVCVFIILSLLDAHRLLFIRKYNFHIFLIVESNCRFPGKKSNIIQFATYSAKPSERVEPYLNQISLAAWFYYVKPVIRSPIPHYTARVSQNKVTLEKLSYCYNLNSRLHPEIRLSSNNNERGRSLLRQNREL